MGFLHQAAEELGSNSSTAPRTLPRGLFPSCLCTARMSLLKHMQGEGA